MKEYFLVLLFLIDREFWKLIAVLFLFLMIWSGFMFLISKSIISIPFLEQSISNYIWGISIVCLVLMLKVMTAIISKAKRDMDF